MRHIDPKHFATVCGALASYGPPKTIYSVTLYLDAKTVVRATWRFKPSARDTRDEMVVTFGAPNCLERALIKRKRLFDGAVYPVLHVRVWPVKKGKK